ncbi:MAG: hypothetical protein JW790_03225 [Dehalococcoidales bacterium]|nr:hypothetical protein [Dehalococcoidales bacterium]
MGKNGAKDSSFIELAGWEIKKVGDGLDENQVVSLINELISQRDQLTQRTEHSESLTKLAERTVTEADKLAEEIKAQSVEQAKIETTKLMAEAEAKARQIEKEMQRIQTELKESVQGLFSQLLSGLEELTRQVKALQTEAEQKLPQPLEEARPAAAKASKETPAEPEEPAPAAKQEDTEAKMEVAPAAPPPETGDQPNPDLELEILPPLDIMKIMDIVTYLDSLPEIENTELIPNTERPLIIVTPRQPINLIDVLSTLPEIDHLEEDGAEAADGSNTKKIRVSLAAEAAPQEAPKS